MINLTRALLVLMLLLPSIALAQVKVVATLPGLAAIASEVGGEHVEVESLASATVDPHFVDPRPNLVLSLNKADLLIVNGLQLEIGWLPKLLTNARNGKINQGGSGYLDASTLVQRMGVPQVQIDRSQGDIHPGGNPHFIYDPRQAARIAEGVALKLASIDPEHAQDYQRNAIAFITSAKALVAKEAARFAALPPERRRIVAYHQSLIYILDWLQLERVATIEPKPGIPPNPGHVAKVLKRMKATQTRAVIQEPFYPRSASEKLASLAKGTLVVIPAAPDFQAGERYLETAQKMADSIYKAVK